MDDSLANSIKTNAWESAMVVPGKTGTGNFATNNTPPPAANPWRRTSESNERFAPVTINDAPNSSANQMQGSNTRSTASSTQDAEPEWTNHLQQLVSLFSQKCSRRVILHRESARYYERRVRWLTIPSAVLGVVSSSAVFATWQQQFCNADWHQYINLGIGIAMLLSTALSSILAKSDYPALYASHMQSFQDFDELLQILTVELCFEPKNRRPVRIVVDEMLKKYRELTKAAKLPPTRVDSRVKKDLEADRKKDKQTLALKTTDSETSSQQAVFLTNWLRQTIKEIDVEKKLDCAENKDAEPVTTDSAVSKGGNDDNDAPLGSESLERLWNPHSRPSLFYKHLPATSLIEMSVFQFPKTKQDTPSSDSTETLNAMTQKITETIKQKQALQKENVINKTTDQSEKRVKRRKKRLTKQEIQVQKASHANLVSQGKQQGFDDIAKSTGSSPIKEEKSVHVQFEQQ